MIQVGSIVKHFKYETLSDEDKAKNKYIFRVEDFAVNTSDENSILVIYRAMYDKFTLYARSYNEFMSKVDKDKYPDIKQEYRFEVINFDKESNNDQLTLYIRKGVSDDNGSQYYLEDKFGNILNYHFCSSDEWAEDDLLKGHPELVGAKIEWIN